MPLIIRQPRYHFEAARFQCRTVMRRSGRCVNYTMFRLAPNTFLTVRNEYFKDKVRQPDWLRDRLLGALHRHHLVARQAHYHTARASV